MGIFNLYPYINVNDLNLDWIIRHFKEFIEALGELNDWRQAHEEEYKELKKLYDDILAGNFPDSMVEKLRQWTIKNTMEIIGAAIKTVLFELTPDGYLVAFIPDSWSEIIFGTTGLDTFPAGVDFGHLTLSY